MVARRKTAPPLVKARSKKRMTTAAHIKTRFTFKPQVSTNLPKKTKKKKKKKQNNAVSRMSFYAKQTKKSG